jgi:predicted dehydrogenase
MDVARIGILGTGAIVREFHLPALLANPRVKVVALGNLRAESLRRLQTKWGIERVYTDFEPMARDPALDAVIIALPNYLHAPVTLAMLRGGKHVLCEKPMAMNLAEANEMIAAAESAQRVLMIGHVWRFDADVRRLRDILRSGKLGVVTRAKGHSIVSQRGPAEGSWFLRPELSGGGALADVGVHTIDTISFLLGDRLNPVRVSAKIENRTSGLAVEDRAHVIVEYDNGLVAEFEAGWFHPPVENPHGAVELFGTEGEARTLPLHWRRYDQAEGTEWPEPLRDEHIHMPMYVTQIDHFLDCILHGKEPESSGRTAARAMVVLDAAYRSAREGSSWVKLAS